MRHQADSRDTGKLLAGLIDHVDAMLAYWNEDRVCLVANAAYRDWFGKSKEEVVGMTMQQLLGHLYDLNLPYIEAAFAGTKQVFEREIPLPQGGGSRHSLATYIPHIENGRVQGIFVHVADVTPMKRLEQELQRAKERAELQAAHDVLTGLPNRLLLEETMLREIAAAQRAQRLLGVLAIDVDNFKQVNDTFGHAAGDRFLVVIAARLRETLRQEDALFRVGGDEFIALLPGIESASDVAPMSRRLLQAVAPPVRVDGTVEAPSVSIGAAICPLHGRTAGELLSAADRALYRSKGTGRARFSLPDDSVNATVGSRILPG